MQRIVSLIAGLFLAIFLQGQAQAILIETSSSALVPPMAANVKGQFLEDGLNTLVLNPEGITVEFAAMTGGTPAVDDMVFEGPGITGITGGGFILRFDTLASDVRVRFGNFKDDDVRSLSAFAGTVDYARSTTDFSQSADGTALSVVFPDVPLVSATGTLPAGNDPTGDVGFLDLSVSDPSGISSVFADTNRFLWSLLEIEVTFLDTSQGGGSSSVPEPGALALFGVGLLGLGFMRRRRGASRAA